MKMLPIVLILANMLDIIGTDNEVLLRQGNAM